MNTRSIPFWRSTLVALGTGLLLVFSGPGYAVDVQNVPQNLKFSQRLIRAISTEIDTNEVRRPAAMEENPRSQIALWVPYLEPPPVVRTADNMITKDARIYRNVGSAKANFPFVVREESTGKWYIFKNVKYHWSFEKPEKTDEDPDSNVPGSSGNDPWTPFMNLAGADSYGMKFIEEWAEDKTSKSELWEKKLYPNRHMTAFDSGIQGSDAVAGSNVLQQIGMVMTYERAEVSGLTANGPGYPPPDRTEATADLAPDTAANLPGTVTLNSDQVPATFVKDQVKNPVPNAFTGFWNLKVNVNGISESQLSAYTLAYVEDHAIPDIKSIDVKGDIMHGSVGGWVGDMKTSYTDDNPNAVQASSQLSSEFKYYIGLDDLYKIDNPFFDANVPNSNPLLFFTYLPANDVYGPYVGRADNPKVETWYTQRDPYWSKQPEEKIKEHMKRRLLNAWSSNFMAPWEKGIVYYILNNDEGRSQRLHSDELNAAWKSGNVVTDCANFNDLLAQISSRDTAQAKGAKEALLAMKEYIEKNPTGAPRDLTRFTCIGCEDGRGRYVVGPIVIEKSNLSEASPNPVIKDPATGRNKEVKSGTWTIAGKRAILPRHFAMNSQEWHDPSKPLVDPNATDPLARKKSIKERDLAYSSTECAPDCLTEVKVSNCCGNSAPQHGLIKVHDDAAFSQPMCGCSISNRGGGTTNIQVPCGEDGDYGSALVVKDNKSGDTKQYDAFGCGVDFDLADKSWSVKKADGSMVQIETVPDDTANPAVRDRLIFEDERIAVEFKPFDNVNRFCPNQGISKTELTVAMLDENKQPTGQKEQLEYLDENGNVQKTETIVRDSAGKDLMNFDPNIKFNHIFRNPGWYQVDAVCWDIPEGGKAPNARKLRFNMHVLDAKFQTQTLDSKDKRTDK